MDMNYLSKMIFAIVQVYCSKHIKMLKCISNKSLEQEGNINNIE